MQKTEGLAIRVFGIVQGVGFRPFVSRTADALEIKGSVANKGSYVEIHAQGDRGRAGRIPCAECGTNRLPSAAVLKLESHPEETERAEQLLIIESENEAGRHFRLPGYCHLQEMRKGALRSSRTGAISTRLSTVRPAVRG
jgi:hydrogenase maturation protein HypF